MCFGLSQSLIIFTLMQFNKKSKQKAYIAIVILNVLYITAFILITKSYVI